MFKTMELKRLQLPKFSLSLYNCNKHTLCLSHLLCVSRETNKVISFIGNTEIIATMQSIPIDNYNIIYK